MAYILSHNLFLSTAMVKSNFTYEYQSLISRLKDARIKANMTQKDAAKKLSKTQSFVSKVENGERRLDVIELAEFSRLYKVPLDLMLAEVINPPKKRKK